MPAQSITPEQFVANWQNPAVAQQSERQIAQSHFTQLCHLLGEQAPHEDNNAVGYAFEETVEKTTGRRGFADVWKRHHFAWEYKRPGRNDRELTAAYSQLQQYAPALENPPLLVVSDVNRIIIHPNWNNTVNKPILIKIEDLLNPQHRQTLKNVISAPERLRPDVTREAVTGEAAGHFAEFAQQLGKRVENPEAVARFINRMVFCMFAEAVGLIKENLFTKIVKAGIRNTDVFPELISQLFTAMKSGGYFGEHEIEYFNGGMFNSPDSIPLSEKELKSVLKAAEMDWSEIDPMIFGTLFERALDPAKRSQLGAHYTHRDQIMKVVEPVIQRPLEAEWENTKAVIQATLEKATGRSAELRSRAKKDANALYRRFLDRLRAFRVLDPACGSGNFLYVSMLTLKDLEHRVYLEGFAMGLQAELPQIGPECVRGIELNTYAAELARVTCWIGEIQWMRRNGFSLGRRPILKSLNTIENRNALLNEDGTEAEWPEVDVIVGNPPFLGGSLLLDRLGVEDATALRTQYEGRVPGGADLVTYWFEKSRQMIADGITRRAGLVTTNSIRGGLNRRVLDRISETGGIYDAWSDEPWISDGAAVRVSIVSFSGLRETHKRLNGHSVAHIFTDLSGGDETALDLTKTQSLKENHFIAFQGTKKGGPLEINGHLAREMLTASVNPNGLTNSSVIYPWQNGFDITRRSRDMWVIDFGADMTMKEASLYEAPFEHLKARINPPENALKAWWLFERARTEPRQTLRNKTRYIVTPRVAKHRVFAWADARVVPDSANVVVARDDDTTFGILHSRFHEAWSLRLCTFLGKGNDPRYTATTTFETFPFPEGLTPNIAATDYEADPRAVRIAEAARDLVEKRDNWLNPADLVKRVPEVVEGFPDRILPINAAAEKILKTRTLTNLYNQMPAWLKTLHDDLDKAVAAAYGWPEDISTDDALARLLDLNQQRSAGTPAEAVAVANVEEDEEVLEAA